VDPDDEEAESDDEEDDGEDESDDEDMGDVDEEDEDGEYDDDDDGEYGDDGDGEYDDDDDGENGDEESEILELSLVSVFSLINSLVRSVVELGDDSWQHSKNAGSQGIPNEKLLKEHP